MDIYLTNQAGKFQRHLERLRKTRIMNYNTKNLREKVTTIDIRTIKKFEQIDPTFLFDYKIFPGKIMSYLTEWSYENRTMKPGDTIAQQVFIPPNKYLSQKIIFGVRIKEIIQEQNKIGYSYETLAGHVEKGISTFTIEKTIDEKIIFKIHTLSAPATLLTKALGPIFSTPYQKYCTHQALQNVRNLIE